jgi:hypothetical protein
LHAFSTRRGGLSNAPTAGLNLGFTEPDIRAQVEENRKRFFENLGASRFSLATVRQVHSAQVYLAARGVSGKLEYHLCGHPAPEPACDRPPAGDALLTNQPGILLSVRTADCLPILLADARRRAVAAIHAGWRGALKRIVEKTVGEMRRLFASRPGDLLAGLGPSIRACCYEVGEEVVEAFCGQFVHGETFFHKMLPAHPSAARREQNPHLFPSSAPPGHGSEAARTAHFDLVAVAREQLLSAGLCASSIQVTDACTSCRTDLFYSHRKEGSRTGRMMAVIGIQPRVR